MRAVVFGAVSCVVVKNLVREKDWSGKALVEVRGPRGCPTIGASARVQLAAGLGISRPARAGTVHRDG